MKSRKVLIKKLSSKDLISVRNVLLELLSNETCKSIIPKDVSSSTFSEFIKV